jgi:ribosomal protein S18
MAARQNLKLVDDSPMQPIWEYKKKYRDRYPVLRSEDHFASHNFVEKQERLQAQELEKPATFINRPLTRAQLRKKFMRSVTKKDIDWRNATLITKFLNDTGKLYNRYQSRLPTNVHRKVAKTVKKMRNLGLLPYVGLMKPTDKIPLGGFIEDVEEMHKKTIDPVTGRMFLRHSL